MRILVALSRFPWPLEKGDKLRAFYQIQGLCQNHEVHLVCLSEHQISDQDQQELSCCKSIHIVRHGKLRILRNLLRGIFSPVPFQVHYFRSAGMKRKIEEITSEYQIDVVLVQLIRLGLNLPATTYPDSPPRWFLDYMDCFSIGMEGRIGKSKWPLRSLVRVEARRLKDYERKIAARFDEFSAISLRDAAGLDASLQEDIHILPNGVGEHFFSLPEVIPPKRYDLIFFGNMGYQPNVKSAQYLVEEVLPALRRLGVEAKLCVAGARPAKSILSYSGEYIEVTGFVDEIRSYVLASRLAIAPVIGGQGLQNKLIESMALGIPTLTTPHSHEALGAEAGKEVVVCSDAVSFAKEIKYLLENPEHAEKIGRAGKSFVEEHFRWEAMNAQLDRILSLMVK